MTFLEHFRNRNLATLELLAAVRAAVLEVLEQYDLDAQANLEEFEPYLSNVCFDIVKREYEG